MTSKQRHMRIRKTCIASLLIVAASSCKKTGFANYNADWTDSDEFAYFDAMVMDALPGADEDPLIICQAHDDGEIDMDLAYGLLLRGEEVPANDPARYLFHDFNKLAKIKGLKCACMGFFSEFPDAEWYTSKFAKAEWTACGWDA